jgi:hypothetical protein
MFTVCRYKERRVASFKGAAQPLRRPVAAKIRRNPPGLEERELELDQASKRLQLHTSFEAHISVHSVGPAGPGGRRRLPACRHGGGASLSARL